MLREQADNSCQNHSGLGNEMSALHIETHLGAMQQ